MAKSPRDFRKMDRRSRVQMLPASVEFRSARERVMDFDETFVSFDETKAVYDASRCIHCPTPAACVEACPLGNDIPNANALIEEGKYLEAAKLFRATNNMPEVCGRVCPHDLLCEGACVLGEEEPIRIGALESFAAAFEREHSKNVITPGVSTGKKVAIIGGGPSGLSCAEMLVRVGHAVTVFEAHPKPGGLLLYGIPRFKLPSEILFEKFDDLERAGVRFEVNTVVGKDIHMDDLLLEGFHAVYVCIGAGIDADTDIPGEDLPGVFKALEFLIRGNVDEEYLPATMPHQLEVGRRVVVIGNLDTSCARTARRLGAEEITFLFHGREEDMLGSTKDHNLARQEGTVYRFLTKPLRFIAGDDGKLAAVECVDVEAREQDEFGNWHYTPIIGSNHICEVDTAVLALGYIPNQNFCETFPGVECHQQGLIVVDSETYATSRPGVFAGGDAVNGPDLVASAIADGRRVADVIDEYLKGE
jgi:glutamate synthase (NADPH) small chain